MAWLRPLARAVTPGRTANALGGELAARREGVDLSGLEPKAVPGTSVSVG
jgi:hypothetical protein